MRLKLKVAGQIILGKMGPRRASDDERKDRLPCRTLSLILITLYLPGGNDSPGDAAASFALPCDWWHL